MYVFRNQTESSFARRIPRVLFLVPLAVVLSVGCSSLQPPPGTLSAWGARTPSAVAPLGASSDAALEAPRMSSSADEGLLAHTTPQRFQTGIASYYHAEQHGNPTASGEAYDHHKMTAAHPELPFGTRVRVINQANGQSVVVRINDRGPHIQGRVIDLSGAAARRIDMLDTGIARVELYVVEEAVTAVADAAPTPATHATTPRAQHTARAYEAKGYAIQMGAFRDKDAAAQLAARFDEGWVHTIQVNDLPMHRVFYGQYDDEVSARQQRESLKQQGHSSFVKALD